MYWGKKEGYSNGIENTKSLSLGSPTHSAKKKQALAALLHAIEAGITRTETVASAIVVARELNMVDNSKQTILRYVPAQQLSRIEQALDAMQPLDSLSSADVTTPQPTTPGA